MRKRRGILLLIGLAVLATVSVAATIEVLRFRLPDPRHADREGLFRWLATSDLAFESQQTRHHLIERLEIELDDGIDFGQIQTQLDVEQKRSLLANTDLLLSDWYRLRCEEFHATPAAQQAAMLDRRIEQVEQWGILDELFKSSVSGRQDDSDAPLTSAEMLEAFVVRTDRWIAQGEVQQRDAMRRFTVAIKGRLLVRALKSLTEGL